MDRGRRTPERGGSDARGAMRTTAAFSVAFVFRVGRQGRVQDHPYAVSCYSRSCFQVFGHPGPISGTAAPHREAPRSQTGRAIAFHRARAVAGNPDRSLAASVDGVLEADRRRLSAAAPDFWTTG
jgi:hypothetical protein